MKLSLHQHQKELTLTGLGAGTKGAKSLYSKRQEKSTTKVKEVQGLEFILTTRIRLLAAISFLYNPVEFLSLYQSFRTTQLHSGWQRLVPSSYRFGSLSSELYSRTYWFKPVTTWVKPLTPQLQSGSSRRSVWLLLLWFTKQLLMTKPIAKTLLMWRGSELKRQELS